MFKCKIIVSLLTISSVCWASEVFPDYDGRLEDDLVAFESRYKVDAKPEPYKPPRPAPFLDDDPPPSTTTKRPSSTTTKRPSTSKKPSKKTDTAEIIYPTTTYRPVNFYLPTKTADKILPAFNKKKPNSDVSLEIVSNDSTSNKKRIRKVKKVLRNNPKNRKKKTKNISEEKDVDETTTLLDVKPLLPSPSGSSRTRQDRLSSNFEPTFPSFKQKTAIGDNNDNGSDVTFGRKGSKLYLPDDSFSDPVRSLPPKSTPADKWRSRQPLPAKDLDLPPISDDEIFYSSKKSRGLPILNQLANRPFNPKPSPFIPEFPSFNTLEPVERFQPEPFVAEPAVEAGLLPVRLFNPVAPSFYNTPAANFVQQPKIFNRVGRVEPVPPAVKSLLPLPTLPPPHPTVGIPQPLEENVDENYDYVADYESSKPRPYSFTYGVKDDYSGTDFSRAEESSGQVTKGSYQVALPDGRTQIVNYIADVSGFKATVSYEGEAVYPGPGEYGSSNQHPVIAESLPTTPPELTLFNIHPQFHQEPRKEVPLVSNVVEDHVYDDYYDDVVPLLPNPIVKGLSPSRTFVTTPSPHPSPTFASATTLKSFPPTYPHFEPLFTENVPASPPRLLPFGPQTPTTLFHSSSPAYSPATFSPESIVASTVAYPSSTTIRPVTPYTTVYPLPTTYRPEYEYFGSQRKRQVNNADAPTHESPEDQADFAQTEESDDLVNQKSAQIVIAEKIHESGDEIFA